MRRIYKSLAIGIASLSLLGAPAYAAVDATALANAITAGNAVSVQALIDAAAASNPTDTAALASIATALTTPPAGGTVNTALLASVAASNGGNSSVVAALGLAMANNLTPATVEAVLKSVKASNPAAANALGRVIVSDNPSMIAALIGAGITSFLGPGGAFGDSSNTNTNTQNNAAQNGSSN